MSVLDLACGHGELANRLAARGCRVTGLDSSAVFLDRARAGAPPLGSASNTWPGTCARYCGQAASAPPSHGTGYSLLDSLRLAGYGKDGRPLTADHKRMVIVADPP